MIAIDLDWGGFDELDEFLAGAEKRAKDVRAVAQDVLLELIEQNLVLNFFPSHPQSILEFELPATFIIGSQNPHYGDLLIVEASALDLIQDYIWRGFSGR